MTVLAFLTPIPHGHSNVHLTILRRLLTLPASDAPTHIHVLSDGPLRKRVSELSTPEHTTLSFHMLDEQDVFAAFGTDPATLRVPPLSVMSSRGRQALNGSFVPIMFPPASVYLRRYGRILDVLREAKPDLVVIDIIFAALGTDACRTLGLRYAMLAPVSSLDVAFATQPGGRGLWKYPMLFTNTPYPIPLLQIPLNILAMLAFGLAVFLQPARRRLDAARKEANLQGSILSAAWENAVCSIYPSLLEIEYPHTPHARTVLAGPILTPVPELSQADYPDLSAFLSRGRTALINMGSLFKYTAEDAAAVAAAIALARSQLDQRGSLQILWKLPGAAAFAAYLDEHLGQQSLRQDWVRIEEWIDPPALAVLQHPNVVVSVHHGGANSVHEALYAGVPQVILPQWYDLYTFATRVETLGHGIYANRGAETHIDAAQLANALVRVLSDREGEEGQKIKTRAEELGRVCRAAKGDERAAGAILAAARGEKLEGVYF